MNITQDDDDARVNALLERVRSHEAASCRDITESAKKEALCIVRQAHREARLNVHHAVVDERRRAEREIEVVRARIETARRQKRQENELEALSGAWERLVEALHRRLADQKTRRLWLDSLVEHALDHLLPGVWRIEHPADWDTNELSIYLPRITAHAKVSPLLAVGSSIKAGLVMTTEGARLDGTVKGLLVNRSGIEGLLLGDILAVSREREGAP